MKYYVNENIKKIDILDSFAVWLNKTSKKSNQSLIDYINEYKFILFHFSRIISR